MARTGAEPLGSMGTDTPISPLSTAPAAAVRLLPPAVRPGHQPAAGRDPGGAGDQPGDRPSGRRRNLLDPGPASCRQIVLPYPVIDNDELAKLLSIDEDGDLPGFKAVRVSGLYPLRDGAARHARPG